MWILKIAEHPIYTTWTSQIHYRTSYVYYVNITCTKTNILAYDVTLTNAEHMLQMHKSFP
jgi:hypothetical protein